MKVAIVIPVFNEAKRIQFVLRDIQDNVLDTVVIVVDDGSRDTTFDISKSINNNIVVLRHKINLGKGAALKTGCEAAIKMKADIIVFMDGDGQHKAEDINNMLKKLIDEKLDIVFGSRTIGKDMPLVMMLGNKFLSIMTGFLFHIYISDTQSGFRAFKTSAYKLLKWNSVGYSVETEMIVNAGKKRLKFGDVAIKTVYTDNYKGTTIIDGIRIFFNMLIWKML